MFAPYVDVALLPNNLPQIRADSGTRLFTLAFVNANQGCSPSWPGGQLVADDGAISGYITQLRASGGDVIIAFGGYDGKELAQACMNVASLQAAYQQVVDKYKAKILDFDVEHHALDDQDSIDRRNLAIANLTKANPGLQIDFTLPATPNGLTAQGVSVLRSAVAQGTRVHIVNVMTMNYGQSAASKNMGANAISAIDSAQSQLKDLGLNAKLGITPMIGMNDATGETFDAADAAAVLSYAQRNQNIALLAFWSVARDNGSCSGRLAPTCSGISQKAWQFSHAFASFH
ncbi:MAG TPA: chitinase [Candidatus Saccharimonadales bacterium]|nr:chitinase [Candidatus Saccharimonadales bacterium]